MSNILRNAYRLTPKNTYRNDRLNLGANNTNSGGKIGFDCSGFVWYVLNQSGYKIPYFNTSAAHSANGLIGKGAEYLNQVDKKDAKPGDLVYFGGHVGVVTEFDPATGKGKFYSMTGSPTKGGELREDSFDTQGRSGDWGTVGVFQGFARPDARHYDAKRDVYRNDPNDSSTWTPSQARPPELVFAPAGSSSGVSSFADTLGRLESNANGGYGSYSVDAKVAGTDGIGALGRYGARKPGLTEAGLMDTNGNWAGTWVGPSGRTYSVSSTADFLSNPALQEIGRAHV